MFQPDPSNTIFKTAEELICGSNSHVFLTGKAGTGKTTFLKYIKSVCTKNLAVVAPTGVAAINAGGTTIHSFFQLPFGPFNYNETSQFFGKLKINNERREVFRQLDLLIIDEISMVRADLLDAIDVVLRHFRFRYTEPFGGVQVLMIGDMYQLPPVVKDHEWAAISDHYRSHYFFDSRAMQQAPPIHIAFDKIYRQQDQAFIDLLNKVRHNDLDDDSAIVLNSLHNPSFQPGDDEHIILTTHNNKADTINQQKLAALTTRAQSFSANVQGEFSDRNYPTDNPLVLKVGARVMFIKNDVGKARRYYNGKIGEVTRFDEDKIYVQCKGEEEEIEVKKETWENIRYTTNRSTKLIDEDVLGSFAQYPLRLAWAVTIHKSQGLTFDKVVIDGNAAFAPGQFYVALSRCTNLKGIVLLSPVPRHRLANDSRVVNFAATETPQHLLEEVLSRARQEYQQKILLEVFDFSLLLNEVKGFTDDMLKHASAFNKELFTDLERILPLTEEQQTIALKFQHFMTARFFIEAQPEQDETLQAKIKGAVEHFQRALNTIREQLKSINAVTDSKMIAKEYNDGLRELYTQFSLKLHFINAFANTFSVSNYHIAKRSFMAPTFVVNAYATSSSSASSETTEHPLLHKKLRTLRDEWCSKQNTPVYMVASGATLNELVKYLPHTKEELLQCSGFGKAKVDKYGDGFLEIIQEYCAANGLSSQISSKAAAKRIRKESNPSSSPRKESTHEITLSLFKQGKTIAEIAEERKLSTTTIQGHLADCVATGDIDPFQFITVEKMQIVLKEVDLIKDQGMNAARQKLGDSISYFDMKLALNYHKRQQPTTT